MLLSVELSLAFVADWMSEQRQEAFKGAKLTVI
jgi:hypothetical protein